MGVDVRHVSGLRKLRVGVHLQENYRRPGAPAHTTIVNFTRLLPAKTLDATDALARKPTAGAVVRCARLHQDPIGMKLQLPERHQVEGVQPPTLRREGVIKSVEIRQVRSFSG